MNTRHNYGGISATSPNQARFIKDIIGVGKLGDFQKARVELSAFLLGIAPDHYGTENAPNDYNALINWSCRASYFTGDVTQQLILVEPIPVFDGACNSTTYTTKAANLAFRAWHDYTHLKLNASFELDDEKRVAKAHIKEAKKRGLSRGARYLLWIDSQGQNEYFKIHNEFVGNQYAFCKACFENGLSNTLKSGVKF